MLQVTLNITLTLEGPILTKSSTPGRYAIDASMAVNHRGKYIIPGTLVKGRLRQSWKELKEAASYISKDQIRRFLGKGSDEVEGPNPVTPYRGLLRFSDFVSEKKETQVLHRIRMDEKRGAVDRGALLMMESPFAPGEEACFCGTIGFGAVDPAEALKTKEYVEKGLKWISSLGSERTVGFGKLVNVGINQDVKQVQFAESQTDVSENGKLGLVITVHSPFCIAKPRVSQNLFESETVIPGNVIKGAVASMWSQFLGKDGVCEISENFDQDRRELSRCFDKIRFTHAFPAKSTETKRPVSFPLSLVKVRNDDDNDDIYDVTLCHEPVLINYKAPTFDIDWKNYSDVNACFGWPNVHKELRVRTAIDREKRKADKGKLFAYESVIPDGVQWLGWIDLGLISEGEREVVERQLRELLAHGLKGLGKTKASASVKIDKPSLIKPIHDSSLEPLDNQYIVTLQTHAILCDTENLNEISDRSNLCEAYREVWNHLSENSLSLVRYFARQKLAGGYYLHERFQDGNEYEPFLLTEAGSVFVLKVENGEKACQKIEEWVKHGLTFPEWARKRYRRNGREGDHWSNCPFVRENGYGEVAVNMEIHTSKSPSKKVVMKCDSAIGGA